MTAKPKRKQMLRDSIPPSVNLAGDEETDRSIWHSYLRLAWDAFYNWDEVLHTPFPGSSDYRPLGFATRQFLASIVFSVAAIEYRLRSVELNVLRQELKSKGLEDRMIVDQLRATKDKMLGALLRDFWKDIGGKRAIGSPRTIDAALNGDDTWTAIRDGLQRAIDVRNKFTHGDPVALGELVPVEDNAKLETELREIARNSFNSVVDAVAFINFHCRYSEGKNGKWATVKDAIAEFGVLKMK